MCHPEGAPSNALFMDLARRFKKSAQARARVQVLAARRTGYLGRMCHQIARTVNGRPQTGGGASANQRPPCSVVFKPPEAWTAFLFYVVFEHSRQCRIKTKGRGSPPSFPFIVISEQPRQSRRLRSQRWRAIPERSRRPRIVTVREWRAIPERSRMQKLVTVRACERSRSGPDGSKSRNVFSKKRSLGAVPEQSRV